jgi:CYTH domain-containing protein
LHTDGIEAVQTSTVREPHREIERKFLIRRMPDALTSFPHAEMWQGYLVTAPGGVQVRMRKAGEKYSLTYKRGRGNAREEREIELTREQFETLWPATEGRRLTKTRYDVPLGDRVVEIDVYTGKNVGLVVAEVEFDDEKSAREFPVPDWLGKDVSHDRRYSNQLLAS